MQVSRENAGGTGQAEERAPGCKGVLAAAMTYDVVMVMTRTVHGDVWWRQAGQTQVHVLAKERASL